MKKKIFFIFLFLNIININYCLSSINNSIIGKVGKEIITQYDLENEIKTILFLGRQNLSQENIDKVTKLAMNSIVRKLIKKNEIEKYKITKYSEQDLENYTLNVLSQLNIKKTNAKEIFKKNGIDYQKFIENYKIELMWNTLIYSLYKNQLTVNSVQIENELNKELKDKSKFKEYNLSEIQIIQGPNKDEVNKLINNIYNTIQNEGFEEAVTKYSISNSAGNNGNIGWFSESSLSKIYIEKIKYLKKNEISKPIKSDETFVILKINEIRNKERINVDIKKIKEQIILREKEEKLLVFSRSHFSNLENSILITFK